MFHRDRRRRLRQRVRFLFLALRAAFFAGCFFYLWYWLARTVRPYDASLGGPLPGWLVPFGWLLVGLGAPLALACVALFVWRGRGTPAPLEPPRELVATGPYRVVRNPMYEGASAVLCGAGLLLRSPALVLLALGFLLLAHAFVVLYEEPVLEQTFGTSYRDYKRSVGRWLPSWRW